MNKECKVGGAIELSAGKLMTEYNGVLAFFRLDLVTTLSGFQFFRIFLITTLPAFHFTLPQSRFVTFSFFVCQKR